MARYFYEELRDPRASVGGECVMVRFYKTHAYRDLPAELRTYAAERMHGLEPDPGMRCLVLLGSAGDRPEWNDPRESRGHRAIPLTPAQDFVREHSIRSVIGFGGLLFNGDLYAVILFTRVPVGRETADRFRNVALDIRIAVSTLPGGSVLGPPVTS